MEAAKQRFEALAAFRKRTKGHSGQQLQVLGLYKRMLRVAKVKDQAGGHMQKAIRSTFRERQSIPKYVHKQTCLTFRTDLETIEFYLAQGERQLQRLQSASVSSVKFVTINRNKEESKPNGSSE